MCQAMWHRRSWPSQRCAGSCGVEGHKIRLASHNSPEGLQVMSQVSTAWVDT